MTQNRKRYKAVIAGKTYTIIGNEENEFMDIVADKVNKQYIEIAELSPDLSREDIAILLALNCVSDEVKKQAELLETQKELADMQEKMGHIDELEARLNKIESLENQAKQVLKKNGADGSQMNHIEAQQILNEQVKEKIKQGHQNTK